jgi:hypothetical protein
MAAQVYDAGVGTTAGGRWTIAVRGCAYKAYVGGSAALPDGRSTSIAIRVLPLAGDGPIDRVQRRIYMPTLNREVDIVGKVAKWTVTVIVGVIVGTVAFLVVLRVAEPTGAKWGLAPAGAAIVLGLAWVIGSSWVNHTGHTGPAQSVKDSEITAKGGGWAVGNAGDIHYGAEPPAKRRGRGGSARR